MEDLAPLLVGTTDIVGGAGIATYRLHRGLRDSGVDSRLYVLKKESDDASVVGPESRHRRIFNDVRYALDFLPIVHRALLTDRPKFSPAWLRRDRSHAIRRFDPDVVHLHWVNGFLSPETIAGIDVPIVWTLHDMWPFTGGCHYSSGCTKFTAACGRCPQLDSDSETDLSHKLWRRKRRAYDEGVPTVVAPSNWLADRARESSLFANADVRVIHNGVDVSEFSPGERGVARERVGLSTDRPVVLFGDVTGERRKGRPELETALAELETDDIAVATFGGTSGIRTPLEHHELGYVDADRLPSVYRAADVTVIPSLQDNLPNVGLESLACGTPVVGFDVGGVSDIVDHRRNGYLVEEPSGRALARGLEWVLSREAGDLAEEARSTAVRRFSLERAAEEYAALYEDVR